MTSKPTRTILFLCGDLMLGRGVDQIMASPSDPRLYESYMTSALGYVQLAEAVSGPIPRAVAPHYVWGDLLTDLEAMAPSARVANLETSITTAASPYPKGINYRMHPGNSACLAAARLDCCTLANNHVLDWGVAGLEETLAVLDMTGIAATGAGRTPAKAARPAAVALPDGRRLLVYGVGSACSGIPPDWAVSARRPGIALLPDLSPRTADALARRVLAERRSGDIVVISIHWGSNWGFDIPDIQRQFARRLIDAGACDVLHGHSSHHPRGIEIYARRLILYGCGDLLNDYEGIAGHEEFRGDHVLAYLPGVEEDGALASLVLLAYRIRRFRLERADAEATAWLCGTVQRASAAQGLAFRIEEGHRLAAQWSE